MNRYRSLSTVDAVQYQGAPIPGVTCPGSGDPEARHKYGCDPNRGQLAHVHANVTGGIAVLKEGDWIFAAAGGPWAVWPDEKFRGYYEVPEVGAAELEAFPVVNPEVAVASGETGKDQEAENIPEPGSVETQPAVSEPAVAPPTPKVTRSRTTSTD